MEKTLKLLPPTMPNFVSFEMPARLKQEGYKPESNTFPISDFTENEAYEYAELMKTTFIEHWKLNKVRAVEGFVDKFELNIPN